MPNEIQMNNVPKISVGSLADYLIASISTVVWKGLPLSLLPAPMLWGAPGVGKSQLVRQVAEGVQKKTGKKVKVTDIRLLLYNPIDLRGIPVANAEKDAAVWLKPIVFQMDDSEDVLNFLLLDEITAAPQSVQAAAYQITLDRKIGEHQLPDNCVVIAAGNRTTDRSVAYKMPKALANRLMHFEVESNYDSWRKWAVEKGVNEKVLGFLAFRRDYLMNFNAATEDVAFATPRSWEMASNVLNSVSSDVEQIYPLLAAILGTGVASELRTWAKVYKNLPSVEDIFAGKTPPLPTGSDALYALVSSMAAYAKAHPDDMKGLENSMSYAMRLPADFSAVLMKDYLYMEKGNREKLMALPTFLRWVRLHGGSLNGII